MAQLTSRERVRRAMVHELPDRVPVMCQLALGHYFLYSQFKPVDIWFDSEVLVKATKSDGRVVQFQAVVRLDTAVEVEYYRNGGILHTVLRNML